VPVSGLEILYLDLVCDPEPGSGSVIQYLDLAQ